MILSTFVIAKTDIHKTITICTFVMISDIITNNANIASYYSFILFATINQFEHINSTFLYKTRSTFYISVYMYSCFIMSIILSFRIMRFPHVYTNFIINIAIPRYTAICHAGNCLKNSIHVTWKLHRHTAININRIGIA